MNFPADNGAGATDLFDDTSFCLTAASEENNRQHVKMGKIPEHIIEEIRTRISLAEVVSQYVSLTARGGRLWGLCPFHDEKTPSFTVNDERGFFHCFGCGKGGSVFNFLMDIENLSFSEAVRQLAEKAGIPVGEESPTDREKRSERDALLSLYHKLSIGFHYILKNRTEAAGARQYLQRRKISERIIDLYRIGYAPERPDWLYGFLRSKGYTEKLLAGSGLFAKNRSQYPLFRHRIVFPIFDTRGAVVAFGGRALDDNQSAKYLNTPETDIFRKREHLFGLYQGLEAVKKRKEIIICEGYFDVAAMAQAGIEHAAAPLGTSFTEQQASRIRRYADTCLLFFDDDNAGRQAAAKAAVLLEKAGINGEVVQGLEGRDPADFLQEGSEEMLLQAVKKRQNSFDYLVQNALKNYDITLPEGKLAIFGEVRPLIAATESEIKRQGVIRMLAELIDIDEATINREMMRGSSEPSGVSVMHPGRPSAGISGSAAIQTHGGGDLSDKVVIEFEVPAPTKMGPELYLMLTLVNNRKYFQEVRTVVTPDQLVDPIAADIFTALEESLREGETSYEYLIERLQLPASRTIVERSVGLEEFSVHADQIIQDTVRMLNLRNLIKKRKKIEQAIRLSNVPGNVSGISDRGVLTEIELNNLLYEKKFIDDEIRRIRNT